MKYRVSATEIQAQMFYRGLYGIADLASAGGWLTVKAAGQVLRHIERRVDQHWVTKKTLDRFLKAFGMSFEQADGSLILEWGTRRHKKKGD